MTMGDIVLRSSSRDPQCDTGNVAIKGVRDTPSAVPVAGIHTR
jgi:hypothetical protein